VDAGGENWPALEQSLLIAQRESANLHGLHVVPSEAGLNTSQASEVQSLFNQRCQQMGIQGRLAIKAGKVAEQICEHALLTDLIVLNVSHPPEPGIPSLGSGLRAVIRRSPRPLLTLPGKVSQFERALLAFDGSLKSKEALFLATYLAERWNTALTVLTIQDSPKTEVAVQDYARTYLELHEIQAEFLVKTGSLDVFQEVIGEKGIDLVVMGGYGGTVVQEVVLGSAVNFLLRRADCPIFICR
jgi:nucleotide-binding universal stress UspA family protein